MTDRARNLIVGVFMLLAMFLLAVLLIWFGESPFSLTPSYTVTMNFPRAGGIGADTSVFMNDIRVGYISTVYMKNPEHPEDGVIMVAKIDPQFSIPDGAIAQISTPPFVGKSTIRIVLKPGRPTGFLPKTGATLQGEITEGLLDLAPKIESALNNFNRLASDLQTVTGNIAELTAPRNINEIDANATSRPGYAADMATLSTVVQRLDRALANFNDIVGDQANQTNVKDVLANAVKVSEDLKVAVADATSAINEVRAEVKRLSDRADSTMINLNDRITQVGGDVTEFKIRALSVLDNLDQTVMQITAAVESINKGQGTLGLLVKDPRLYEGLDILVKQLQSLTSELQAMAKDWKQNGVPLRLR